MNYIILNDVNSNTIQGLIIQNLPPITKPQIRTNIEEIDGRDGDVITKLGYSAYEKEFDIGLYGNYDVDQVISYFNSEGTVIFSNEDDKFYKYTIIEQIDFERLIRFKTAKVKMHVQPFKYSNTDTDIEIYATETDAEGTNLTINNTENGASFLDMQLKGQTTQDGTPTPTAPVNVNVVTGNTNVNISNINLLNITCSNQTRNNVTLTNNQDGSITLDGTASATTGGFTLLSSNTSWNVNKLPSVINFSTEETLPSGVELAIAYGNSEGTWISNILLLNSNSNNKTTTISIPSNAVYVRVNITITSGTSLSNFTIHPMLVEGNKKIPFVAHQEQNYEINLGKNLINATDLTLGTISQSDGVTISTSTSVLYTQSYIKVNSNQKYTISYNGTANASFRLFYYDNSKTYLSTAFVGGSQTPYATFTTLSNAGYIRIQCANNFNNELQLEAGSTATSYAPYFTPIELCQIGGYQDYIYKNNGNWFIHKAIEKVVLNGTETWSGGNAGTTSTNYTYFYSNVLDSIVKLGRYNGFSDKFNILNNSMLISTSVNTDTMSIANYGGQALRLLILTSRLSAQSVSAFKTWLSNNNVTLYYVLNTPTDTQITDENLIAQLEALRGASTYIGQTNIITSGDLAPIIYVNVDTIDTNEIEVINSGNIYSKPVVTITGLGTINLYLNDYQVFILELGDTETTITLDVENMEAYNINTGQLMNRQVTGDYNNFIFNAGTNIITWSGTIASVQIVNYSRWI